MCVLQLLMIDMLVLLPQVSVDLTFEPTPGALQYILHTKVGEGPRVLATPLLKEDGLPIRTATNS